MASTETGKDLNTHSRSPVLDLITFFDVSVQSSNPTENTLPSLNEGGSNLQQELFSEEFRNGAKDINCEPGNVISKAITINIIFENNTVFNEHNS